MEDQYFYFYEELSPVLFDELLAFGWRRAGNIFYKVTFEEEGSSVKTVLPLRIAIDSFYPSKSQRRNLRKNSDLKVIIRKARVTDRSMVLFEKHKQKFTRNIPESIEDFIGPEAFPRPVVAHELAVYLNNELIALSYIDEAEHSMSSVYACYHPELKERGLGVFTLLKEIEVCKTLGKKYLYLGYAFVESSFYDYKKRFNATEALIEDKWIAHPRLLTKPKD